MDETVNRSENKSENETTDAGPGAGDSTGRDLVEPEGVNAASREIVDERAGGGDVTSGGAPERAQDQISERHRSTEMAGVPGDQDGGPGQQLSVGEG